MSTRFEWDPRAGEKIQREVVKNAAPHLRRAVEGVRCPDHPAARFSVEARGDHWELMGICCEKGKTLAEEAIGRAIK